MVANTSPIFPLTPHVEWTAIFGPTARTEMDGTGTVDTNIYKAFESPIGGAGSIVNEIRIKAANNANNAATAVRIFINNGSTNATAGNNALIYDISLPLSTYSTSLAQDEVVIQPDFLVLPASYRLYCTVGVSTGAAGTGIKVTVFGGDY